MAYFLGIDVGAARTVAAVARAGSGAVETVDLGDRPGPGGAGDDGSPVGVASVLHLAADGVLTVGAPAQRRALTEPDRVARGFPGLIGDDAILLAGEPWAPEELTAWLVRWVVDRVAEREGAPATGVAVSHPASWDAERVRLLAGAVAEQDLEVAFLAPAPEGSAAQGSSAQGSSAQGSAAEGPAAEGGAGHLGRTEGDAGALAAGAAAEALRAAATVAAGAATPASVDGSGSGRHAAVDRGPAGPGPTGTTWDRVGEGSGRHLAVGGAAPVGAGTAGPPAPRAPADDLWGTPDHGEPAGRHGAAADHPVEHAADDAARGRDRRAADDASAPAGDHGDQSGDPGDQSGEPGSDDHDADGPIGTADPPADHDGDPAGDPGGDRAGDPDGDRAGDPDDDRDASDRDAGPDRGWEVPAPRSPHPADPATANLLADLVGFTGGMGATNTAGLLSGYTPPQGMPALWGAVATATATDSEVALPAQRAESGRWAAVAPEDDPSALQDAAPVAAPARQNPTLLVSAGGLAAAVAVVATLFLWPAPRITDSAARPVAAVPAATTAAEPSAVTVALTPTAEPTPVHRSRPATPRTHRPVVPLVTAPESVTESTVPPTDSTEPTEPRTTAPPSTSPSTTTTTTTTSSSKAHNN